MGQIVALQLSLTVEGDDRVRIDDEHVAYLHGHGNIVPGLERALEGRTAGEVVEVVVPPEEGYGFRQHAELRRVPLRSLAKGFKTEPGTPVVMHTSDGDALSLWIAGVDGDDVLMDECHPLAGCTLVYRVRIVDVREARVEELLHGHAHPAPG